MDRDQGLAAIFKVVKMISSDDNSRVVGNVLSSLLEALPFADAGIVWIYDPADGRLAAKAAIGLDMAALGQIRLRPGESLSGEAFQTGRSRFYPTPQATAAAMAGMTPTNRRLFTDANQGVSYPKSAICAPLAHRGKTNGVLLLMNLHGPGGLSPDDTPFLELAAGLLAFSIEGAHLRGQLEAAQTANESSQVRTESLSFLAHEMRTPLTTIKGYSTALLMEDANFEPEAKKEFLRLIDEECDTLVNLVHDLLESSIIDAGPLKLERQPVLLPRLVRGVVDDVGRHTPKHRFLIEFPKRFPIAEADPGRIAQVLRNLLENAAKYSPHGGLIVVRGEVRQDEIVISVADQGIGIAPEHLNRLFEKFFRVKSGPNRDTVGSGLGLPIARSVVESHGGRIWAESQLGRGTTLYFTLPLTNSIQNEEGPLERANE